MPGVWDGVCTTRIGRLSMWQERLFPELTMLASEAERRNLVTAADQQTVGWGRRLTFVVVVAVIVGGGGGFVLGTLLKSWALPNWLIGVFTCTICVTASLLGVQLFWRKPLRAYIRRELNQRGIPVCLHCAYNLTGLPEPRCPECGQPFEAECDEK